MEDIELVFHYFLNEANFESFCGGHGVVESLVTSPEELLDECTPFLRSRTSALPRRRRESVHVELLHGFLCPFTVTKELLDLVCGAVIDTDGYLLGP